MSSFRWQKLKSLRASHALQCITLGNKTVDVDEVNSLGIEIWYRTTRRFSILDGINAIRSVPKKYRTQYPALVLTLYLQEYVGSPTLKHMATELWGLVVLFQLGQSHGRLFPAQVPLQRALKQQLSQQVLILRVQVGAQAVDLGDVTGQVLVHLFG